MSDTDFDDVRRRRVRAAGTVLLVITPVVFFLAGLSFGIGWPTALGIAVLVLVIAFVRWRLKYGTWPWAPPTK